MVILNFPFYSVKVMQANIHSYSLEFSSEDAKILHHEREKRKTKRIPT